MSISVAEAEKLLRQQVTSLEKECLPLELCSGRILAENLLAPISQPPFSRSPLDGYAVIAADLSGACKLHPASLRVIDKLYAGMEAQKTLKCGQAVRIMTGAMMPQGADCVVRQEDTDEDEQMVHVFRSHKSGENCICAGDDYHAGDLLLPGGIQLDASAMAIAASSGIGRLTVFRQPKVAIILTGDELLVPGTPISPGKIYDSSRYYLQTRLAELDAQVISCVRVKDDLAEISCAVSNAAACADLVLTTGGISVGQKDFLPVAFEKLGADFIFQGVTMKPGMPTTFVKLRHVPIVALSGNPFAAIAAFEVLVRPLLYVLGQNPKAQIRREHAILQTSFQKKSPHGRYLRGIRRGTDVFLPSGHSNGQLRSLLGCNCLVEVAAMEEGVPAGSEVVVIPL